ncbi:exodeoxyribonuclease VII small subunit [Crocosphaera chwakensis]|uniref:Exodeoxyribonuclease 7 small subunit n=1 Tax=Crocosphaera chwakensis CCY0110 TaxID=391612 RepID=A3IZI2_9CHRO|nr:exodeoxyribonuclease VII small subunit [Crocosphaera chwakensis]EAZ88123.1 hypothetical protein CY0110_14625 [Crocosphaera chwakensis CCY0110]
MDSTSIPNDWDYETAISSVEEIINNIESGNLPLENVFQEFEVAVQEINQCEQFLNQGMEKMELLIETLEEEF